MKRLLPFLIASLCAVALAQVFSLRDVAFGSRPAISSAFNTNGLVAYWRLEETGATTRTDATGRGNDLTAVNSPGTNTGKINLCNTFAGASVQYLSSTNRADLQLAGGDFSISLWFYSTSLSGTGNTLINKRNASDGTEYQVWHYNDTNVIFYVFDAGGGTFDSVSTNATLNAWHHLICTWTSASKALQMVLDNGSPVTKTSTITPQVGDSPFGIGSGIWNPATGESHNGYIDEISVWKRVLSAAEITTLYNSGNGYAPL